MIGVHKRKRKGSVCEREGERERNRKEGRENGSESQSSQLVDESKLHNDGER